MSNKKLQNTIAKEAGHQVSYQSDCVDKTDMINIILAKDFNLRVDLENHIRNTVGLTSTLKPDYIIQGTKQELNKLFLSDKSLFWGIRTEITDNEGKVVVKKQEKNDINRGKILKSGINIKN